MTIKLSNTNQRRVIIEELKKLTSHPTADELYEIVKERLPKISLGTVYRNLEQLSAAGLIWKLELSGSQNRFDGNVEKHFHKRCPNCGAVEDIEYHAFAEADRHLTNACQNYAIEGYTLEFRGLCYCCQSS
ncbi:transcriptional repressor [Lentisphaerota bacterium WC36G]|nr:transcriptional repressor [Lentisphaerae bacterium WC36]